MGLLKLPGRRAVSQGRAGDTLGAQNAGPVCRVDVAAGVVTEFATTQAAAAADGGRSKLKDHSVSTAILSSPVGPAHRV